jgi:23S rRNA (cytidine1920-2'-O)/16S rRNA (cytidine1409-2'-O)-methyltransferase
MSRLDQELVARGLARSRTQAQHFTAQGVVAVDGRTVVKASAAVTDTARIDVAATDHYGSRAATRVTGGRTDRRRALPAP